MFRFTRLLSLSILFWVSTILASGQVKFTQSIFDTNLDGVTPNAIVAADFDKDGILDLELTVDVGLFFYKGLGGGKFSPFQQPGHQINAGQVVAADFNRDGNVDIAFIPSERGSGGVSIANGNGDEYSDTQLLFSVRHSIAVTDYTVRVWSGITSAEIRGEWIPADRLKRVALTGLARKILRKAEML